VYLQDIVCENVKWINLAQDYAEKKNPFRREGPNCGT
jgi:hypothetical protein